MDQLASKEVVDHILSHHGVKGMKWGVRRRISEARAAGKVTRGDKAYEKRASSIANYIDIHNEAADRSNKLDIERINNKPKWKAESEKGTFLNEDHPTTQAYYKEHQDAYLGRVKDVVNEIGANTSGTKTLTVHEDPNALFGWNLHLADVKHGIDNLDAAKPDVVNVKPKIAKDTKGRVVKIHPMNTVEHGELFVGDILAHHGVKGMKWGVRRRSSGPTEVTVTQKGKRLKSSGGKYHTPHPDAIAAQKIRQQLQKSGAHSLSNQELRTVIERGNLVSQAHRVSSGTTDATSRIRAGNNFVGETLRAAGHVKAARNLAKEATA